MFDTVLGYTYSADIHCPDCAKKEFGDLLEDWESPDFVDFVGNVPGVIFPGAEFDNPIACGDCFEPIQGVVILAMGFAYGICTCAVCNNFRNKE